MPGDDLYKILGVDKDADSKSIKKAYRKAAKKAHPDMEGGNEKKFALVKKSFDILSDDKRRAKYDETGDDSGKQPDNEHGDAINFIAFAFNAVLASCVAKGKSPLETDIVQGVKSEIDKNVSETQKQIRVSNGMLEIDRKLAGRFSKGEHSIFDNIISHRINQLRTNIASMENSVKNGKRAIELIRECQFRKDDEQYETPGVRMMSMLGASYV